MANWLESDARPIVAGWGPEPSLSAPPIGETLKAILANRLGQQKLTQDTLSDAIKAQQSRNQDSAFAQALQGAGVVPSGVNVSGMSGPALAKLAELYQGSIPDKELDNLHDAMANSLWTYPGGKGTSGVDFSEHSVGDTWIDPGTGITMYQTRTGPRPFASPLQPSTTRTQNQNQLLSEQNKLLTQQGMLSQQSAAEQQQNMAANKPNVPFSQADLYNRNATRLQELQRQLTMPHADQPNGADTQDQTAQPSTTATPPPTGGPYSGPKAPPIGTVDGGYKFTGGDPQDPNNWQKVQ